MALLLLRVGLHLALLHEAHDEIHSDELILCPHCGHVVPDMAFCPACGVATPRRRGRRGSAAKRGRRVQAPTHGSRRLTRLFDARDYTAPALRRTSYLRLMRTWGVAIVVVAFALVGLSVVVHKPPARYVCPPDCGHPPTGKPVATNPRFTAQTARSPSPIRPPSPAYRSREPAPAFDADLIVGDGGTLQLFSQPANGRTPKDIAKGLVKEPSRTRRPPTRSPTRWWATSPGYGEVADCWPQGANSNYMRMRVMVMVAVKNDLALVAAAVGPFTAVRPRLRARQAVGREPAARPGHGQIRQQLQLARRPGTLTAINVDIDKCHHLLLYFGAWRTICPSAAR